MPERLIILWPNRFNFQTNKKFDYTNRFKYKFLSSSSVGLVENNIFDKFESSIAFIRGIKAKQLGVFISLNHYILGKALFECCQSYKRYTHQIESKLVHFSHKIEFINNCRRTEKNEPLSEHWVWAQRICCFLRATFQTAKNRTSPMESFL